MADHSPDNSDLILAADIDENGTGDIILKTRGLERARITAAGVGSGLLAKTRADLVTSGRGLVSENFNVILTNGVTTLSSQTIYGTAIGLRTGDVVTNLLLGVGVAAAGTAPTTARFGLADKTGKILALSGNLNGSANWTATGQQAFPLSAAYTVLADDLYLACFVVNGSWSVTQPSLGWSQSSLQFDAAYSTGAPASFQQSGQTDLPALSASMTITAGSARGFWMGVA